MARIPESWLEPKPEVIIGRITDIRPDEGEYGRQIVVEIQPVNEQTPRILFFRGDNPTSPRSKWQRWLKALEEVGIPRDLDKMIGTIARFECLISYHNINGEERMSQFWKPTNVYPDEESALTAALAEFGEVDNVDTAAIQAAAQIPDDVRTGVKALWDALDGVPNREDQFKNLVSTQYPDYPVADLMALVK